MDVWGLVVNRCQARRCQEIDGPSSRFLEHLQKSCKWSRDALGSPICICVIVQHPFLVYPLALPSGMEDIQEPSQTESTNPSLSASQELSDQDEFPRSAQPYNSDRVDLDKPRKAQHSPFFLIPKDVREII